MTIRRLISKAEGVRGVIIAKILQWNQPEIFRVLSNLFHFDIDFDERIETLDEDEMPEFLEMKKLMEERRGVAL